MPTVNILGYKWIETTIAVFKGKTIANISALQDNLSFLILSWNLIKTYGLHHLMTFSWFNNLTAISIRALGLAAKFILVLCMVKYFQPEELGLYGLLSALIAYGLFFLGLEFYNYTSRALIGVSDTEKVLIIRDQFLLYGMTFILLSPVFYGVFYLSHFPVALFFWFFLLIIFEIHSISFCFGCYSNKNWRSHNAASKREKKRI